MSLNKQTHDESRNILNMSLNKQTDDESSRVKHSSNQDQFKGNQSGQYKTRGSVG